MKEDAFDDEVYRFFLNEVDTIPQMEALLLLWDSRPRRWSARELSERLYLEVAAIPAVMAALVQRQLARADGDRIYEYSPTEARDRLMEKVASAYRQNLVRATTIIHSKASSAAREFARAFRLGGEKR